MTNKMERKISTKVDFYSIVNTMSKAMDLISETVVGHHKVVAYISLRLGIELNLDREEVHKLLIASLVHDMGVFYLDQNFSDLTFDKTDNRHALIGYELSKGLFPEKEIAEIIKHHHHEYGDDDKDVPYLSHIIHLADRIAVILKEQDTVFQQTNNIKEVVNNNSGIRFWPRAVEKFNNLFESEAFWLDTFFEDRIEKWLKDYCLNWNLDLKELLDIGILISHIIDFRSAFTATHSQGVAKMSSLLAEKLKFSHKDVKLMEIAGYFHDIGKLAIPTRILNKPGKLNKEEWQLMKTHTYYTYKAMDVSPKLERIKKWASYHHEKLNGEGYPFHCEGEDLDLGSRIMAVADVFTAITEDRPYRDKMNLDQVKQILDEIGNNRYLDKEVTAVVLDNIAEFNDVRQYSQRKAEKYYQEFHDRVEKLQDRHLVVLNS